MDYITIIGLEIHIELKTNSKMFCASPNDPDEKRPNFNVCPICMGHPGTLPVINKEAVNKVIKTGLALNCQIPEYSKFDRKNYFYPDLPKGYQISQYDMPFCKEGYLEIDGRKIHIRRIHLEEDTGRLIHQDNYSLVDFNRAGIPLMELVTEPNIRSASEARKFAEELQLILRYLGISEANMEKGQMRVEVNLSLTKNEKKLGTKVEIKNLNSFRSVEKSIDYEVGRQTKALENGEKIIQETRGWDDAKGKTISQREKEEAFDYRYFPEPDLPPLHFKKEEVEKIKASLTEPPQKRRERFKREYNLDERSIEIFVQNKKLGEYFEKVISELEPRLQPEKLSRLIKLATNYLITDLQNLLKEKAIPVDNLLITPENFSEFISLIHDGKISSKIAKIVLAEMFRTGDDPSNIIEEKGISLIENEDEIKIVIEKIVLENKKAVDDFKQGKKNSLQFLIGKVISETKGRADPETVKEMLGKILGN
jgi:aspartyl-tRNA(Asn)/glutamyl-tRNA(Gln) amidotransferase subunit B